jgi:micrococcal nuclease
MTRLPLLVALVGLLWPPTAAAPPDAAPAIVSPDLSAADQWTVVRVIDGDTIAVRRGDVLDKVRLIGVDTPETQDPRKDVQFYAKEGSAFLSNLLKGESVHLRFERPGHRDKYGRALAHVYRAPDGLWVNLEIIRQGYGQVYTAEAFEHVDLFLAWQRKAREAEKGLWDPALKAEWGARGAPAANPAAAPAPAPPPPAAPPQAKPVEPGAPVPEAVTVYITRTGTRYHRASCGYLRSSSIPIDLREAKARYAPCSRCDPPQ